MTMKAHQLNTQHSGKINGNDATEFELPLHGLITKYLSISNQSIKIETIVVNRI